MYKKDFLDICIYRWSSPDDISKDKMIIKDSPQDFIVEEMPGFILKDSGDYCIYKLVKSNLNTEQAADIICSRFHIEKKNLKYAGSKDKNALTTQYISIYKDDKINIDEVSAGHSLKVSFIGYLDTPLSLGCLEGNNFEVIIRELGKKNLENFSKRISGNISDGTDTSRIVPNYFDDQRFSSNNKSIGICMLKKDFKNTIRLICEGNGRYEDKVREYILEYPTDYVGALKTMPKKILMMYLHSVQSYIFNETLAANLKRYAEDNNIPYISTGYKEGELVFFEDMDYSGYPQTQDIELVGFDSKVENSITSTILRGSGLTQRDFIIRSIPELSVEGGIRKSFTEIKGFSHEKISDIDDAIRLKFSLPKGSYATIVIRQLFC